MDFSSERTQLFVDISDTWDTKINALLKHASQVGDKDKFLERMRTRRTEDSTDENPRYEEMFRRIVF